MNILEFKRLAFSVVSMSIVMTAVLSFYWTLVNASVTETPIDFAPFIALWMDAWLTSFLIACPASLVFAPPIKKLASKPIKDV